MIQFSDFTERMNYELWTTLFFISYFLVGEIAFNGKSIGKSAFYLQTRSVSTKVSVSRTQLLLRSLLKGLSCSFFLLGLANLLFFIFNRNKFSLHDFASKTTTIQNWFTISKILKAAMHKNSRLAFVGAGKMVSAIVRSLLSSDFYIAQNLICCSANDGTSEKLSQQTGIRSCLLYTSDAADE